MTQASRTYDLVERLIQFAVAVMDIVEAMPAGRAASHIAGQLIRSGTSPAPNYGEAQSAESRRDFLHKMKVALKELRETWVWLRIIDRKQLIAPDGQVSSVLRECEELIRIFVKSIETAEKAKPNQELRRKMAKGE